MPDSKISKSTESRTATHVSHLAALQFRVWRNRPGGMRHAHTHPDVEINCVTTGSVRYFAAGRFQDLATGDIAVFWGGMPHQSLERAADTEGVWITFPLTRLLRDPRLATLAGQLMAGTFLRIPGTPLQHLQFTRWEEDFRDGAPVLRELAGEEIVSLLVRLSLTLSRSQRPERAGAGGSGPAHRVEQIAEYISAHYAEDIAVADIARNAGLHPKYLLSFFAKTCGIHLWDYVILLRLAHAHRLLATTDRTVGDIAMEAGFGSFNAFYRAFRKHLPGVTPGSFRKLGLASGG